MFLQECRCPTRCRAHHGPGLRSRLRAGGLDFGDWLAGRDDVPQLAHPCGL